MCLCVLQKKNKYTIPSPSGMATAKKRARSFFSLSSYSLFSFSLFLTRHYDRIYQRCRLKNTARCWSHCVRLCDIFRRNGFDPSSFFFSLFSDELDHFLICSQRYLYVDACSTFPRTNNYRNSLQPDKKMTFFVKYE